MKYKNICKFGLFVKDLDRVIKSLEIIECSLSDNIRQLLKENKLIEIIEEIKIEKKEVEKFPKKSYSRKRLDKKELKEEESIGLDEDKKEEY